MLQFKQKNNSFEAFGYKKSHSSEEGSINEKLFITLVNIYCKYSFVLSKDHLNYMRTEIKNLVLSLLNASLLCWGLSTYCDNYIDLWINQIKSSHQQECSEFIAKVVSTSVINMASYLDILLSLKTEIPDSEPCIDLLAYVQQLDPSIIVEDNEDVHINEIKTPFSPLILGAIDVLKEKSSSEMNSYFICVMKDYLYHLNQPEIFCKYLLQNEIIFNNEVKEYFNFWATREGNITSNIPENDLSSILKGLFMNGSIPSASDFCDNMTTQITDQYDVECVCKQLFAYIQSEYKISSNLKNKNSKKRLKFFLKVFRNCLKICQHESEGSKHTSLFEYLIKHPFTIKSYDPFVSSDPVHKEIENLLCVITEKYSILLQHVKPFLEKLISLLNSNQTINEISLLNSTLIYLNGYNLLTYDDIERLTFPFLSYYSVPLSDNVTNILNILVTLLLKHSSTILKPSNELPLMMIRKVIYLSQIQELSDSELKVLQLLSKICYQYLDPESYQSLELDDYINILKSRRHDENMSAILKHAETSVVHSLIKRLNKLEVCLSSQASFILSLLKNKFFNKRSLAYLSKVKEQLMDWALGTESEMNNLYQEMLGLMIENQILEISEVETICKHHVINQENLKMKTPYHIVSLVPCFDHLEAMHKNKGDAHPHTQLMAIVMSSVAQAYKKKKTMGDSEFLSSAGHLLLSLLAKIKPDIKREFHDNKIFYNFIKQVLKEGYTDNENGPILIKCLAELTTVMYSAEMKDECVIPPKILYQMLRSHSQFFPMMLSAIENDELREQIIGLQLAIVESCPLVCEERHIPILLGAYGATRSRCDQLILKILYLYEASGNMPNFEPTLWGRTAVSYFAVEKDLGVNIEYRSPDVHQILSLIDHDTVINTALNFDMNLGLEPVTFAESDISLYDQRFLLSIFLYVTKGSSRRLDVMELIQKGIVAIGFAALSSYDEEVWSAGAALLHNITTLFEESSYRNLKLQWMWMVAVLGYGLENKQKKIPFLTINFFIRASELLLRPNDPMYAPVMNYLYLKPAFSLYKPPEFYNLFFTDDVQYNREHRAFLFEMLGTGIRDGVDFKVCEPLYVPKLIFSAIKSLTINSRLRILALGVLKAMVRVPTGAASLVFEQSLLEELPLALTPHLLCPVNRQSLWIEAVVDILTALWQTWKERKLGKFTISELIQYSKVEPEAKTKLQDDKDDVEKDTSPKKKRKLCNGDYVNVIQQSVSEMKEKDDDKIKDIEMDISSKKKRKLQNEDCVKVLEKSVSKQENLDDDVELNISSKRKKRKLHDGDCVEDLDKSVSESKQVNTNNDIATDECPKKERKLHNGNAINVSSKHVFHLKKVEAKAIGSFLQITMCLGSIINKVINEGTVGSISQCFEILTDLIHINEALEKSKKWSTKIVSTRFLKQEIKTWIHKSNFVKRFQGSFTIEDSSFFSISHSQDECKFLPIVNISTEVNEEFEHTELTDKVFIQLTKKLLTLCSISDKCKKTNNIFKV